MTLYLTDGINGETTARLRVNRRHSLTLRAPIVSTI
jgi:hypothetical protein